MDNPFDQFDTAPTAPTENPFNQFSTPEEAPGIMPHDEFIAEFRRRLADKKQSPASIVEWARQSGRPVTTPKNVRSYANAVRAGRYKPEDVPFDVTEAETNVDQPAIDSGANQAFERQFKQGLFLDFQDDLNAFAKAGGAVGDPFQLFSNGWLAAKAQGKEQEFWDRYQSAHDIEDALSKGDYQYHPNASYGGYGLGLLSSALVPGGEALSTGNAMARTAKMAGLGGALAAIDTAGQNAPGNRGANVPEAFVTGAIATPIMDKAIRLGGRAVAGVANATGLTDRMDALAGRVNAWAQRLGLADPEIWKRIPAEIKAYALRAHVGPEEVARMREAADTFRRAGVEPRALDTMNRSEQDIIAAAGRRDKGAGRERLYDEATNTANNIGSEAVDQFGRVTNINGNAREMAGQIQERRNYRADQAMNSMRNKPMPLTDDTVRVLMTPAGQSALRQAMQAADPATREAMREIPRLVRQMASLGPDARRQVLAQQDSPFTVGIADRMRIALNDAAQAAQQRGRGGLARDIRGLRDTLVNGARAADPQYAEYLSRYAEDSRTLEALDTGRNLFSRNTDEFVPEAEALSDAPNAVLNQRDMQPSTGQYEVRRDKTEYGQRVLDIDRVMPNGDRIHFHFTIASDPAYRARTGQDVADMSVSSTINGQHRSYGDSSAFNEFGPDTIRDATAFFRERYGAEMPDVRGVSGSRVGGIRERNRQDQYRRIREANEARARAEREANIQPEYDTPHASSEQDRATARRMWEEYAQHQSDAHGGGQEPYEDPEHFLEEAYNLGRVGAEPSQEILREFRALSNTREAPHVNRSRIGQDPTGEADRALAGSMESRHRMLYLDNSGEPTNNPAYAHNGRNPEFQGYDPERGAAFERSAGFHRQSTVDELLDHYPDGPTYEETLQYLREAGIDVDNHTSAARDYASLLTGDAARRAQQLENEALEAGRATADDYAGEAGTPDERYARRNQVSAESTAEMLYENLREMGDVQPSPMTQNEILQALDEMDPFEEGAPEFAQRVADHYNSLVERTPPQGNARADQLLRQREDNARSLYNEYQEVARSYAQENGEFPWHSFEEWLADNMYDSDLARRFGEPEAEGSRLREYLRTFGQAMRDETGAKALPSRQSVVDAINRRRPAPEPQTPAPLATTSPSGVRTVGSETRIRNERPDDLNFNESFHRVQPSERNAPSDRQLAVSEARRELERRTGESVRGAFDAVRRLARAPEQQRRNEALLGRETAAALQRTMDALLRKAENTTRVAPSTGSPTALREGDDAALSEMMQFFGNAMIGNKGASVRALLRALSTAGMTQKQLERLLLRVTDPTQTDAVINDLAKHVGNKEKAHKLVQLLANAQAHAVGFTLSTPEQ